MKTSITISLLPSKATMPFVLGPDLRSSVPMAAQIGYDAFELFPPSLEVLDEQPVAELCREHDIQISTIGTGGGAVSQGLTLTDPDGSIRGRAFDYVSGIIERAGELGAPAIIGSMQGRVGDRSRPEVLNIIADALARLGEIAAKWHQPVLFEPLNRYESDLFNRVEQTDEFLKERGVENVSVLADLFHMNIEEVCIVDALQSIRDNIGHVHFVDSNRWTAGSGHSDLKSIANLLTQLNYDGYLAVEAFPLPNQETAALQALTSFQDLGLCEVTR